MPRYSNSGARSDYDPQGDALMKAAQSLQMIDQIDAMGRRDQQMQMQAKGLELENQRVELDIQKTGLSQRQEQRGIQDEQNKLNAHGALADFASVFDPADIEHRQKADWYRSWATGQGMTNQEVLNTFQRVDAQLSATNGLLDVYKQHGVTDWEKTPDGKHIDVQATEFKARQNAEEMEISKKTWGPRDKELHRVISKAKGADGTPMYNLSDSVALVNANRQILNDYLAVVSEDLWKPPDNFAKTFAMQADPSQTGVVQKDNDAIGYGKPMLYNRDAIELDPGFIKARKLATRVAAGEVPIFETNEAGEIVYKDSVAVVKSWTRSKEDSAVIKAGEDTVKARADAVIANQEAINKTALGSIGARADAAAKLTNASINAFDPATKAGIDADIAALYNKNGGGVAVPALVPTNGDAGVKTPGMTGVPGRTGAVSKYGSTPTPSPTPTK